MMFTYLKHCPHLKTKFFSDFQYHPVPEGIATNIKRLMRSRISQNKALGTAEERLKAFLEQDSTCR